jgi:peptidoglycan hydrolase CwlO-like protein
VNEEFEELMRKCKNRDEEIESYKTYASILENEIAKLSN